jgi:colanic acid/amylovoran biosynthesis glycosyltransferase
MKILFIVNQFPVLSETFILNQITGLINKGYEVNILAAEKDADKRHHKDVTKYELINKTYYYNCVPKNKVVRVLCGISLLLRNIFRRNFSVIKTLNFIKYKNMAFSLRLLYLYNHYIDKGNIEIAHCHFGPNGKIGLILKDLGLVNKVVVTFHGYDIRLGLSKGRAIYSDLVISNIKVIAISKYNHANLLEFGFKEDNIIDMPNGINVDKYKVIRKDFIQSKKRINILTVARLVPEKGLQYALRALKITIDNLKDINVFYTIVGDGPEKDKLIALANNLNISDFVNFKGSLSQSDALLEYKNSDIFLLTSIAEALPTVLLEASAAGLAVVSTNVGSVDEIIDDGINGFLVADLDVDALSDRLYSLAVNPELRSEMGKCGRDHVIKNYNENVLNEELVQLYKKVLKG